MIFSSLDTETLTRLATDPTRRCRNLLNETITIADTTINTLHKQSGIIDNLHNDIKLIDNQIDIGKRKIRSINSPFGTLINKITSEPQYTIQKNSNKAYDRKFSSNDSRSKNYKDNSIGIQEIDRDLDIIDTQLDILKLAAEEIGEIINHQNFSLSKSIKDLDKLNPKINSLVIQTKSVV